MRKSKVTIIMLVVLSFVVAFCTGCENLEKLGQDGSELLAEQITGEEETEGELSPEPSSDDADTGLPAEQDSVETDSELPSEPIINELDDGLPTMQDIDEIAIPEEELQYLTRYFNDGFNHGTGGHLTYQDLHWDLHTQINPSEFADSDNFDAVVLGDNVYIQYFIYVSGKATYKIYQYNLNSHELLCVLDEEDFDPYIYQSNSLARWDAKMIKTDSTLVFVGAANGWENILEYDPQHPEQGLQYMGKYFPEQEDGNLSLLEWWEWSWNNGNGIYKVVARGKNGNVITFEFSATEGKSQNVKIYEETVLSDNDIFYGEVNGEMINYYLREVTSDDPITGAEIHKSVLVRYNMDTGASEEIGEFSPLTILPETVKSSVVTSKLLVFRAGYPDKETYIFNFDTKELDTSSYTDFWSLMEKSYPTDNP